MNDSKEGTFAIQVLAGLGCYQGSQSDGEKVLKDFHTVLGKSGVTVGNVYEDYGTWKLKFSVGDDAFCLVFGYESRPRVWQLQVLDERGMPEIRSPVPLVFCPVAMNFVGTERDPDVALAPGEYPPPKSAVRVLAECVVRAVNETRGMKRSEAAE